MGVRSCSKRLSHSPISLHCPIAARAWRKVSNARYWASAVLTDLDARQMLWPFLHVHTPQANADSARGDEDDSVSIFM